MNSNGFKGVAVIVLACVLGCSRNSSPSIDLRIQTAGGTSTSCRIDISQDMDDIRSQLREGLTPLFQEMPSRDAEPCICGAFTIDGDWAVSGTTLDSEIKTLDATHSKVDIDYSERVSFFCEYRLVKKDSTEQFPYSVDMRRERSKDWCEQCGGVSRDSLKNLLVQYIVRDTEFIREMYREGVVFSASTVAD